MALPSKTGAVAKHTRSNGQGKGARFLSNLCNLWLGLLAVVPPGAAAQGAVVDPNRGSYIAVAALSGDVRQGHKSFLVLFFKKELLSSPTEHS